MRELIDRQQAIDVIDKEQKEIDVSDVSAMYAYSKCKTIIKQLPSVLSTNLAEVGTDAISRDAVKELLNNNGLPHHINPVLWKELNDLPSAQPKRGRWERHYSRPNVYADLFWHCSECGYKDGENYAPVYHHFCPNCGAKMEGADDE